MEYTLLIFLAGMAAIFMIHGVTGMLILFAVLVLSALVMEIIELMRP